MNFFEEKTDIYYEQFSFWVLATLFTLIQSTLVSTNCGSVIVNGYCFYNLLWYITGSIYFIFACVCHWKYFESYYHLHDINKMDNYTASLSRWIAEKNRDLS